MNRNHTVRLRAIDSLLEWAELGHPQAQAALSEVASDHRTQDVTVWTKALNRIALFGDASVEQGLLRALADTGHRGVRWSALACADLSFHQAVPLITALLEHPDPMVREGACEALGLFEEHAAVPALCGGARRPGARRRRLRMRGVGGAGRTPVGPCRGERDALLGRDGAPSREEPAPEPEQELRRGRLTRGSRPGSSRPVAAAAGIRPPGPG
ncbi:HEAT repeat domain-containing protein [Streptomyces sp. NPDC056191]|uniref:HEAT repeat domain-containing protein n=1 Tax=Streptomyces sp. NPDC056191 TaxID=3345742 RepID=UPI0035E0DBFE